jgi:hypothetical protein
MRATLTDKIMVYFAPITMTEAVTIHPIRCYFLSGLFTHNFIIAR